MKSLVMGSLASLLIAVAPAFADGGHGHSKHWDKHAEKEWRKAQKHWAKHHRPYREEVVVQHYYAPPPPVIERHYHYVEPVRVYSPPPGVHVVMPNIFIPF